MSRPGRRSWQFFPAESRSRKHASGVDVATVTIREEEMRVFIALPLLALAACQVTKDDANDSMTVEYNQDVAENGLEDVGNTAGAIADTVANDVQQAADKVENKADKVDVDVDVKTDGTTADANAN
jgi:hypothetical protein